MNYKFLSTLKFILKLITSSEKKNVFKIISLLSLVSLIEIIGIASIFPFLAIVSNADIITQNKILNEIYLILKSNFYSMNINLFMIIIGILSITSISFSNIFKVYSIFKVNKFIETFRHNFSLRLLSQYISQPYEYFMYRHTSELTKNVMSEIDFLIVNIIRPIIEMLSHLFVVITMIILLIFINPLMTLIVIILTSLLYFLIYFLSRNRIAKYGDIVVNANKKRFKTISDIFSGIKYIKIQDIEKNFLNQFENNSLNYINPLFKFQTLVRSPKYILEALVFSMAILLIMIVLITNPTSVINDYIPIIGLFVVFAYKTQPGINAMYTGLSSLRYGESVIKNLFNEFKKTQITNKGQNFKSKKKISPKKEIFLKNISFKYKNSKYLIRNFNLKIKAGDKIGFFGPSGLGKTTLLDLIVGLCKPSKGFILVDGYRLKNNDLVNWRKCIGYVQQKVFISDSSFAENIAFGVPKDKINYSKVIKCAKIACLDNFINSFKKKYDGKVGENGARLSGGQNQRIGIARALYKEPDILVLDEATNALDLNTEKKIMRSLSVSMANKTLIIVSHKINTLQNCNNIVLFERDKIKSIKYRKENVIKNFTKK